MNMIKLQAACLIVSFMVFLSICGATTQSQTQKSDAIQVESAQTIVGQSWSESLKEWGLKLGYLLAFCLVVRYVMYSDKDVPGRPFPPLQPWEYIDKSGQIGSIYSSSALISKNYPSFFNKDGNQIVGSQ